MRHIARFPSIGARSFAALALVFLASSAAVAAEARPNIIFMFTDDHASHAIGAYGSKINVTPNLDRLSAQGMRFDNCFCTNSICGPSRAVILTGKHSHLNGFMTNGDRFDGSQQTVSKLLRASGYQTAVVGKWHLKTAPTGFDYWEVLIGQGPYYNPPMRTEAGTRKHIGYTTDIITDLALDWLDQKRDKSKPFFLMYQHKAPHREWAPGPDHLTLYDDVEIPEPATLFDDWEGRTSAAKTQTMTIARHMSDRDLKFVPPRNLTPEQLEKWNAAYGPKNEAFKKANLEGKALVRWKYQRYIKDYLRCIASVDDNIGRLLEYLEKNGLSKNTVVMYSSDQGFYLGDHGWYDKRWMYEESLRMPFIVRWPDVVKAGSVNRDLVQNLDFAETFLEIAGASIPSDMQGRSLVPLLKGGTPADWRKSIYYHYLEFPGAHSVRRHFGVRTDRYKLIRYYGIDEWELFDLAKDPDELRSVYTSADYAGVVADLKTELTRLQGVYRDTEPTVGAGERSQRALRRRAKGVRRELVLLLDKADARARTGIDPAAKPLTVGASCVPKSGDGVIIAQGGEAYGYSIYLRVGVPHFTVRNEGDPRTVRAKKAVPVGERVHLAAAVRPNGRLVLYVGGEVVAEGKGYLLSNRPADSLTVGSDAGSVVGDYAGPFAFEGELSNIRLYWGVLPNDELSAWVGEKR